jgi:hypothetical protein
MLRGESRYVWAARRRHAVVLIAAAAALIVVVLAATALAATPKPGSCWGRCGGPEGPIGGYFRVAHNDVIDFEDSQKCLGKVEGFEEYIDIPGSIPVAADGHFSWSGKAGVGDGMAIEPGVITVGVNGHFITHRTAKVSLLIALQGCGPVHLKIHRNN